MIGANLLVKKNTFGEIAARFDPAVETLMRAIGNDIVEGARPHTPIDTGELVGSTDVKVDGTSGAVTWGAEHAPYQNFGTSRGIVGQHFAEKGAQAAAGKVNARAAEFEGSLA